jgi:O-acetyl-ADP-ribose deacetylase (regulator of RNase III)
MREVTGNVVYADEVAIGHGVNLKGLMGMGVAKAIRMAYPQISGAYIEWCKEAQGGEVQLYKVSNERVVVNIATQDLPGADARYDWLAAGLARTVQELHRIGLNTIAIPRISAGIGGLDWDAIKVIINLVEVIYENQGIHFEFVVYTPEQI